MAALPCTAFCGAELAQLRVRVIALENLVISLLAEGSGRQLDLAREMAAYISPRPGCTLHRATRHAATQMRHLARRAGHFRTAGAQSPALSAGLPAPGSARDGPR